MKPKYFIHTLLAYVFILNSCERETIPFNPSDLEASAVSETQINVIWTDNSDNEEGFIIEQALGGTSSFAKISSLSANSTSYQSTGLKPATSYSYRVCAFNKAGKSEYAYAEAGTDGPIKDETSAFYVLHMIVDICKSFEIPTDYSHTYANYYVPNTSNKVIIDGQVSYYNYSTTSSWVHSSSVNVTFTFDEFVNNGNIIDGDIPFYEYIYSKQTLSYYDSKYDFSIYAGDGNVHIKVFHPDEKYNIIDDIQEVHIYDINDNQNWLRGTITGKSGITYTLDL